MLSVRILPRQHELFAGYLLRLADVNGLTSIEHLLKIISDEKIKSINSVKWSSSELSALLPTLSDALDIPFEVLRRNIKATEPPFGHNPSREVCPDIRIAEPRFCLACIKEGGVIDCRSPLPLFASCVKHNRSFINSCPACEHQFGWHTFIFDGCLKCGLLWSDFDNVNVNVASELEKKMWFEVIKPSKNTAQKVSDIIETIFAIARPFDTFPDRFYTLPACSEINHYIRQAYSVLEYQNEYESWATACFEKRSSFSDLNNAVLAPILKLENRLSFFNLGSKIESSSTYNNLSTKRNEFIESYDFIRPCRAKVLASIEDKSARYHVNRKQLESFLGFKEKDLFYSIQLNTLHAANGTAIARDQIFNLNNILIQLSTTNQDSVGVLSNSDNYAHPMRMHLCSRAMLINAILLKQVSGQIDVNNTSAQIFVLEQSLNEWLIKEFDNRCKGNVSLVKAATALCCGPQIIQALLEAGSINFPAWSRRTNEISGESLKAYWLIHHDITETGRATT